MNYSNSLRLSAGLEHTSDDYKDNFFIGDKKRRDISTGAIFKVTKNFTYTFKIDLCYNYYVHNSTIDFYKYTKSNVYASLGVVF